MTANQFDRLVELGDLFLNHENYKIVKDKWAQALRVAKSNRVIKLHKEGYSDGYIAKKTGIHKHVVGNITTAYWNNRMEVKPEETDDNEQL